MLTASPSSSVSRSSRCAAVVLIVLTAVGPADAQERRFGAASSTGRQPAAERTRVSVEILYGRDGGALHAQQWLPVFEQFGVPVRMRQPVLDDKPDVREQTLGGTRQVTVVGRLDRTGRLLFPGRTFSLSESAKLGDWLRELQTFGAQGTPEGQPVWGLNRMQFAEIYAALSHDQQTEVEGQPLEAALMRLGVPDRHPLRLTPEARERLASAGKSPVRKTVKGLARGTALAAVLNDYGLAFRPQRTPEGAIELAVESLTRTTDVWPVGWELKETQLKTAPQLFQMFPAELEDVRLTDVLEAAEASTEIPIFLDHYRIEARQIELDALRVSYGPRRISWFQLLNSLTVPNRMTRELRIDEQGRPFVWISILQPRRPE